MHTADTAPAEPIPLKGAWTVFADTFARWKAHWRVFTGIGIIWAATMLALVVLGAVAAGFVIGNADITVMADTPEALVSAIAPHADVVAPLLVIIVIAAAIAIVASTWMGLATVQAWDWVRKEHHDQLSVRRAYAMVWPLVPGYIWISILALALLVLGLFGFVLPGILLALAFSMLATVAVMEKKKGRDAIMRATALARPYLLTIFWRLVVTSVVLYVPGQIGKGIVNAISDGAGDALYQLYGIIVGPIVAGVLYATYREIHGKEKKQHFLIWLSLERMALAGAVLMAVVLFITTLVNR